MNYWELRESIWWSYTWTGQKSSIGGGLYTLVMMLAVSGNNERVWMIDQDQQVALQAMDGPIKKQSVMIKQRVSKK